MFNLCLLKVFRFNLRQQQASLLSQKEMVSCISRARDFWPKTSAKRCGLYTSLYGILVWIYLSCTVVTSVPLTALLKNPPVVAQHCFVSSFGPMFCIFCLAFLMGDKLIAMRAAIHFVNTSMDHTLYLCGPDKIGKEVGAVFSKVTTPAPQPKDDSPVNAASNSGGTCCSFTVSNCLSRHLMNTRISGTWGISREQLKQ